MTIKFGWGWKIALLYSSFVALMLMLVIASSRQKFDLVSKDYYKDEIEFQKVIDANHNQQNLEGTMVVHADDASVKIDFPQEFAGKDIKGNIVFYSAVDKEWDKSFPISASGNTMAIDRTSLKQTTYKMKVAYTVDGKSYYKEHEINLSK